jgi:hypothetical protein
VDTALKTMRQLTRWSQLPWLKSFQKSKASAYLHVHRYICTFM